jgi:hypothetical protein
MGIVHHAKHDYQRKGYAYQANYVVFHRFLICFVFRFENNVIQKSVALNVSTMMAIQIELFTVPRIISKLLNAAKPVMVMAVERQMV